MQVDRISVSRLLGAGPLGHYTRGFQLARFFSTAIGTVVEDVLFPNMSALQQDISRLRAAVLRSLTLLNTGFLALAVFLAIAAREIVLVLLGSQWQSTADLLPLLVVALPFRSTQRACNAALSAVGRSWAVALGQCALLVVVTAAAWIGTLAGVKGVALAVSLAVVVHYAGLAFATARALGLVLNDMWSTYTRALPFTFLVAIVSLGVREIGYAYGVSGGPLLVALILAVAAACVLASIKRPRAFFGDDGIKLLLSVANRLPARVVGCRGVAYLTTHWSCLVASPSTMAPAMPITRTA
jgi:PST family polysaccharide transporter